MPSVFVYEFVTARRLGEQPGSPLHSLFVEGRAMRDAATADFAAVPGAAVRTFPDGVPSAQHRNRFRELAKRADWTLVIAPETGGELEHLAREVLKAGGKLLGPSPDAIALTADKLALARHWAKHRIPQPVTNPADDRPTVYPAVLKLRDGAGSEDMQLLNSVEDYEDAVRLVQGTGSRIVQPFVPGLACSVAFLVGPPAKDAKGKEIPPALLPLLPTAQRLSDDGRFKYLGGQLPLSPIRAGSVSDGSTMPVAHASGSDSTALAQRAVRLASKAVTCVRGLFGYVGVDLILGDADDGSGDVAVEINPRLTTSYVGLRAAAEGSLAGLLLDFAAGKAVTPPVWKAVSLAWTADGAVLPA